MSSEVCLFLEYQPGLPVKKKKKGLYNLPPKFFKKKESNISNMIISLDKY